jgi:hypothetical protein
MSREPHMAAGGSFIVCGEVGDDGVGFYCSDECERSAEAVEQRRRFAAAKLTRVASGRQTVISGDQ